MTYSLNRIPPFATHILRTLDSRGFASYLVGGCVRDILMKKSPHDYDIATSAKPDDVKAIFPRTVPTGEKYGTITVLNSEDSEDYSACPMVEVTTFRVDGRYPAGDRHPESVSFAATIGEDLSRRDFTINAMALDLALNLIDPFHGQDDIKKKTIRCVGDPDERFREDPLRMLRAFRFSATLGFKVFKYDKFSIAENHALINSISAERIRDEVTKTLTSDRPEILAEVVILRLLPGVSDAFELAPLMERLRKLPFAGSERLAAFCALLFASGVISDPMQFLEELKFPRAMINAAGRGAQIVVSSMVNAGLFTPDNCGLKRICADFGDETAICAAAAYDVFTDSNSLEIIHEVIKNDEPRFISQLKADGNDMIALGLEGEEIGNMLRLLLECVISEAVKNRRKDLLDLAALKITSTE